MESSTNTHEKKSFSPQDKDNGLRASGFAFAKTEDVWTTEPVAFDDGETNTSIANLMKRPTPAFYIDQCERCDTRESCDGDNGWKVNMFSADRAVGDAKRAIDPNKFVWGGGDDRDDTLNLFGTRAKVSLAHIIPKEIGCSFFWSVAGDLLTAASMKSEKAQGRFF